MTTPAKPDRLLFRFRPADWSNGISRVTLARLAEALGLTETQVMHDTLKRLAVEVLPAYEADDGELTPEQLDAIRQAEPPGRVHSVSSSLFCCHSTTNGSSRHPRSRTARRHGSACCTPA
jgi:hypothetical protein